MKHLLRARRIYQRCQRRQIADVGEMMVLAAPGAKQVIKRRLGLGRAGNARHLRPQAFQPQTEPATLEAGMTGDEDAAAGPESGHVQTFQGAAPAFHISSR